MSALHPPSEHRHNARFRMIAVYRQGFVGLRAVIMEYTIHPVKCGICVSDKPLQSMPPAYQQAKSRFAMLGVYKENLIKLIRILIWYNKAADAYLGE